MKGYFGDELTKRNIHIHLVLTLQILLRIQAPSKRFVEGCLRIHNQSQKNDWSQLLLVLLLF